MKYLLFALLALASQLTFSQEIKVISNEQIPISRSEGGFLPVLSPTGDYLIMTSSNMQGLQKYDLTTGQTTVLTTEKGAGYGAQISADGNSIVYRSTEYKGRLRYTTLKSINVETGKKNDLVKSTRNLQGVYMQEGTVLAINNGKMISKRLSGKKLGTNPPVASIKNGQLYVTIKNKTRQVSPAGTDVSYLWPSISPDGKKLLYYVMEQGKAYISNLDGSNPVNLGTLRAAKWMGNDWVVGMLDKDNGEVVTSSKIVAVKADGKGRTVLTDDSVIAMTPSASLNADKIVYSTDDGRVFMMKVKTN